MFALRSKNWRPPWNTDQSNTSPCQVDLLTSVIGSSSRCETPVGSTKVRVVNSFRPKTACADTVGNSAPQALQTFSPTASAAASAAP